MATNQKVPLQRIIIGTVIGILLVWMVVIPIFYGIFFGVFTVTTSLAKNSTTSIKPNSIVNLNDWIDDRTPQTTPFDFMNDNSSVGLLEALDAIKVAKERKEVLGIYINADEFGASLTNLEPIRRALEDFKTSGKFIVSYADAYSQQGYYLASISDMIAVNPIGSVSWHGMASLPTFFKNMYDKLGIKYQVFKVGTYKSAVEPYIMDKMSDANRQQVDAFISDMWSVVVNAVSQSRNISPEQLNAYADEFLDLADTKQLLTYGLVDTLMYKSELKNYFTKKVGCEEYDDINWVSLSTLAANKESNSRADKEVAVLYAAGTIISGELDDFPFFGSAPDIISDRTYVREINKLADDEDISAVVFRINSGGGSAYASEQIWKALMDLKAKKPLVVSMGDYAASGGYYISTPADKVLAEHSTLTGSIGVFGLIPEAEELQKTIGLNFDVVKTNKHADLMVQSPIPLFGAARRPLDTEEQALMQASVERTYDLFLTRCADGRSKTKEDINAIGQGRVWTGAQALEIGLVDSIGGLKEAISIAAELAKLDDYYICEYPTRKPNDFAALSALFSMKSLKTALIYSFLDQEFAKEYLIRTMVKPENIFVDYLQMQVE